MRVASGKGMRRLHAEVGSVLREVLLQEARDIEVDLAATVARVDLGGVTAHLIAQR